MIVYIPKDNIKEREYILDTLLREFLGLNYEIYYHEKQEWFFLLANGNKLIFPDGFFF